MINSETQNLAAQIALFLQNAQKSNGNDFLRESLEKINQRLDNLESQITSKNPKSKIQNPKSNHFSQEKFNNLEELADEMIAGMETEKACPYEPTGKPCDHCSMCSSFGY